MIRILRSAVLVALLATACAGDPSGDYASDRALAEELIQQVVDVLGASRDQTTMVLDAIDMRVCADGLRSANVWLHVESTVPVRDALEDLERVWSGARGEVVVERFDDQDELRRTEEGSALYVSPGGPPGLWFISFTGPCRAADIP